MRTLTITNGTSTTVAEALFSDSPSVLARREEMRKGSTITDGFNDSAAGGSGGNLDM